MYLFMVEAPSLPVTALPVTALPVKAPSKTVASLAAVSKFLKHVAEEVLKDVSVPEPSSCLEWDGVDLLSEFFRERCFPSDKHPGLSNPVTLIYEPDKSKAGWFKLVDEDIVDKELLGFLEVHVDLTSPGDVVPPNVFSLILANQVLEHVSDVRKTLSSIANMLAPGGHLVASTPFFAPNHGGTAPDAPDPDGRRMPGAAYEDYWRFAPQGMVRAMRDAGLEVVVLCVFHTNAALLAGAMVGVDAWYWDADAINEGFECFEGSDEEINRAGALWTPTVSVVARKKTI